MTKTTQINRGDDIYERFMESKVNSEDPSLEYNTKISDLKSVDIKYNYECDLYWENLTKTKEFKNINKTKLDKLNKMDPMELAHECGKTGSHKWKAYGDYSIKLSLVIEIIKSDNTNLTLNIDDLIVNENYSFVSSILFMCLSDNEEPANIKYDQEKDIYLIDISGNKVSANKKDNIVNNELNINNFETILINYLSTGNIYSKIEFKKPTYDENDNIYIVATVLGSNTNIKLKFSNPENNKKLWNIADTFGNGDIMLIDSSAGYISHDSLDSSSKEPVIKQNNWNVYENNPNNQCSGIINKIKKYARL